LAKTLQTFTDQITIEVMVETKLGRVIRNAAKKKDLSTEASDLLQGLLKDYHKMVDAVGPRGAGKSKEDAKESSGEEKEKDKDSTEPNKVDDERNAEAGGYEDDVEDLVPESKEEGADKE